MNTNEDRNISDSVKAAHPANAMDTKKEVEQSPDPKTDQDYPGYPHYPAKEDIMNQESGNYRVDAAVEDMGTGVNASGVSHRYLDGQDAEKAEAAMTPQPGNGRDDMQDELEALDGTEDEIGTPQNVSNEDLKADGKDN